MTIRDKLGSGLGMEFWPEAVAEPMGRLVSKFNFVKFSTRNGVKKVMPYRVASISKSTVGRIKSARADDAGSCFCRPLDVEVDVVRAAVAGCTTEDVVVLTVAFVATLAVLGLVVEALDVARDAIDCSC